MLKTHRRNVCICTGNSIVIQSIFLYISKFDQEPFSLHILTKNVKLFDIVSIVYYLRTTKSRLNYRGTRVQSWEHIVEYKTIKDWRNYIQGLEWMQVR